MTAAVLERRTIQREVPVFLDPEGASKFNAIYLLISLSIREERIVSIGLQQWR